jgi:hypothetical protein
LSAESAATTTKTRTTDAARHFDGDDVVLAILLDEWCEYIKERERERESFGKGVKTQYLN